MPTNHTLLTTPGIRCVLFDLGDTLWMRGSKAIWDSMEKASHFRAASLLRTHFSPSLLPALDDLVLGSRLRADLEIQIKQQIHQQPFLEPNGPMMVQQTLRSWQLDEAPHGFYEALFEALRIRIPEARPLFPDALETLEALKARGFLLGIVTNRLWGGEIFQKDLEVLGLRRFFEPSHMAISADLGLRKPNPQIFHYVLDSFGIKPSEAVMVGDSLRADIAGGKRLGLKTIWKPKPQQRERVSLSEASKQAIPSSSTVRDLPPAGLLSTDDDYVLAHHATDQQNLQPDMIIDQLGELLALLPEEAYL